MTKIWISEGATLFNIAYLDVLPYMWWNTEAPLVPQCLTCAVSSLRWTMTRWRRLIRRSLTTLLAPKRPTTSDRCLRRTTQAGLSGSPITGCRAGSTTPPTHQLAPCVSTILLNSVRNDLFDSYAFSTYQTLSRLPVCFLQLTALCMWHVLWICDGSHTGLFDSQQISHNSTAKSDKLKSVNKTSY